MKTNLGTKLIAGLTAVAMVGAACVSDRPATPPESRTVTLQVWTNVQDEAGVRHLQDYGTSTFTLGEFTAWDRKVLVDGAETTDLASARSGARIVVPLNTGETATLTRTGDRLELVDFTGPRDTGSQLPRGAVRAVRMLSDGYEVYLTGSANAEPDTIVELSGLDDLAQERTALVSALALQALLVSLEDGEQIAVPVAMAIIAAIVGSAWLAVCGSLAWECANRCKARPGFQTKCAGVTVSINPTSVTVGGGYSCRCF